jgi:Fic family protein
VHILFQQPYCRIRDFEKAGIAKRQAASEYLQALATRGLLRPVKVGTQVLYLNETLLKILGK